MTQEAPVRAYLRADDRRRDLLDAAARVFARDGIAGLTMVAVADEADVSRRLVYNHFADLAALYDAFFDDRFASYRASIDRALAVGDGDLTASFTSAFARLLGMPADDQAVIRLIAAGAGVAELEGVRRRFRDDVEARWLPRVRGARARTRARARLWALVNAFLALADLAARGEITRATATELALDLFDNREVTT